MTSERDQIANNAELFSAIRRGKLEKIKKMLKIVETDIVDANDKRNTPLHCAVEWHNIEIIELLLNSGADITSINDDMKSPLDLARDLNETICGKEDIVKILESNHKRGIKRKTEMVSSEASSSKLIKIDSKVPTTSGHAKFPGQTVAEGLVTYSARGLKDTSHGTIYQIKLLMLFLVKGVKNMYCFDLATEWTAAEKFDDIVFRYKDNDKWLYRFVQAKHRQDDSKTISLTDLFNDKDTDFSLTKYFKSYQKIIQNKEFNGTNDVIKDFIICTNIDFKYDDKREGFILSRNLFKEEIEDPVLNKPLSFKENFEGKQKIISILKNQFDLAKLPNRSIDADISDFLAKLKFAVKQSNEVMLKDDIKEIMGKYDSFYYYNAEIAFDYIFSVVLDWFKAKEGTFLTYDRGKEIFDDLYKILSSLIIIGNTTDYCSNIHNLHVSFDSTSTLYLDVDKFLQSEKSVLIIINEHYTLLSAIKVHQALMSKAELNKEGGFIFVDMSTMKNMQEQLLEAYSLIHEVREGSNLLVIDCKAESIIESKLLVDLTKAVEQNAKNKLILLTLKNDIYNFQFPRKFWVTDHKNSICDFDLESQNKLLETQIDFQGCLLSLNKLVSNDDDELKGKIEPHLLYKLINMEGSKESIKLGDNIRDLGEIKDYYIERTIERRIKVKIDCLSSDTSDIFAMENVDEKTLSKWQLDHIDVVMFNNMMDDFKPPAKIVLFDELNALNFEKLCQFYPNRNIHWVERSRNKVLLWKKSCGSLFNLRQYIDHEHISSSLIPQKINDICENLVIIAAGPGMGKTTVLTHLANQTKDFHPSMWIVRINLLDHTKQFFQSAVNSKATAVDFLFGLLNLKNVFHHELFESFYKKPNKLAILLDGFDEMTPFYKDIVIELLKHLNDANVKLWVTTRSCMREQLEDGLSTFAYVLRPFSEIDQREFLKKLWSKHSTNEHLQGFIDKILKILSNLIQYNEDEFMGVPLLMQMIAEIFENYLIDGSSNLPEILDLKKLYDEFIERKWNIYVKEKLKSDGTNPTQMKNNKISNEYFKSLHLLVALKTLFSDEDCEMLLNDEQSNKVAEFINDITKGDEKTGIINLLVNGKPEFIHRTFAEYFAAQYFENNFRIEAAKNLLNKHLFNDNNKVMRHFFDRALAKTEADSIHVAVLNREKDKIVNLLKAPENASKKDKAGRTGLHLAAANGYKDIVLPWLDGQNTNLSHKDDLFGWSSISYAGKAKHWDIVDLLIAEGADVCDVVEAIKDDTKDKTQEILLHLAAQHDHIHLAKALIRANVNLVNVRNENNLNRTPLHLAAKHKHLAMVKLLVENNANVNAADDDGSTSVHEAAFSGNLELINELINADSTMSLEATDIYGRTPLYRAAENNKLEIMEFLLNKGVNVNNNNAFDTFGRRRKWTALHVAASNGRVDIFNFLISRGAQQDLRDGYGRTPFDTAVHGWQFSLLQELEATDEHLLHAATSTGRLDVIKNILINKNLDETNNLLNSSISEWTPLHRAAMRDNVSIIQFLLEKGVDINVRSKDGTTALIATSYTGSLKALRYLISRKADINLANYEGWTALHGAAQHGYLENFKVLENALGSDFRIDVLDIKGSTSLLTAAYHGKLKMVKYLVENGADINKSDEFGATPLMAAALSNSQDVCKYLLNQRNIILDLDRNAIFGKLGLTPLHAAAAYDALEIVKSLVEEHKININAGIGDSATPLHLAAGFNSSKSVQYFVDKKANMVADVNVEKIWEQCSEAFKKLHPTSGKEMMNTVINVVVFGLCQLKKICRVNFNAAFISKVMKYNNPLLSEHGSPISSTILKWFLNFPKFKQQIDLLKAYVERNKLGRNQPTDNMPFTVSEEGPT